MGLSVKNGGKISRGVSVQTGGGSGIIRKHGRKIVNTAAEPDNLTETG